MKLLLPFLLVFGTGAPPVERIEMTTQSWGRPMSQWSIDAQGDGEYTRPEPGVFNAKRLVTYRIRVGTDGFAKIRSLLEDVERYAGRDLPCTQRLTDAPYGSVRWLGDGMRELRFDSGCRDPEARTVLARLERADREVATWGVNAPVARTQILESK